MRNPTPIRLLFAIFLGFTSLAFAQIDIPRASPRASTSQVVGITHISVDYGRPSVRGREIWGKLVPYGFSDLGWAGASHAPWRAGADENTIISFEHPVSIEGKPLAAGSYGLHMAPEESGDVVVIFSKDTHSWGSYFYNPSEDALRVSVHWKDAPHQEQLAYAFSDVTADSATLSLLWGEKQIPIALSVDTHAIVLESLRNQMRSSTGFRYQNLLDAASYLLANDYELEQALEWANIAVERPWVGRRNKESLSLKAKSLEKMGRADEAKAVNEEISKL